jgi:mannosyltransferase OCH1-like enzyme
MIFNIPKIIHQINIGSKPISQQTLKWMQSWKDYNPQWEYTLWDNAQISSLDLVNKPSLDRCNNLSEKSDILRFEILYQFGGLYVDTDFQCLKSLDSLFENTIKDPLMFLETPDTIGSAFLAASCHNDQIKLLVDNIETRERMYGHTPSNIKYGPVYITQTLGLNSGIPDGSACSNKTVYPYLWWEKHRKTENFHKTHPEAYAVHHWNGSWQ